VTDKYAEILQQMGAKQVVKKPRTGPYDVTQYQTSHLCGAPSWAPIRFECREPVFAELDVPNLFVQGASAFRRTRATIDRNGGALAYWSAPRSVRNTQTAGPLVHA